MAAACMRASDRPAALSRAMKSVGRPRWNTAPATGRDLSLRPVYPHRTAAVRALPSSLTTCLAMVPDPSVYRVFDRSARSVLGFVAEWPRLLQPCEVVRCDYLFSSDGVGLGSTVWNRVETVIVRAVQAIVVWLVITYVAHELAEQCPRRHWPKWIRKQLKKKRDQLVDQLLKVLLFVALLSRSPSAVAITTASLFAVEALLGPGRQWTFFVKAKRSTRKFARQVDRRRQQRWPQVGFARGAAFASRSNSTRCGAPTARGGLCQRKVDSAGQRCYQHQ